MNFQNDHEHTRDILGATQSIALRFLESLPTRPSGYVLQELSHDALPDEGVGQLLHSRCFATSMKLRSQDHPARAI